MNVYLPNGRLPSAYQEVEYIQSSGTQYIQTNIVPSNTKGIYIKISSQDVTTDLIYIGSRNGTDTRFRIGNAGDYTGDSIYIGWNTNEFYSGISTNTIYEVKLNYLNSRKKECNGTTISSNIGTLSSSSTYPIYIFAGNNRGSIMAQSKIKLYSCKISDGSNVVNNFVPCYRKSDNVIGLYDLVNSVFYTNAGTGTFSKGNDVTMAELKNAYIGEVYEYSYDFRGKSIATCQSDGWSFSSTSTVTINSDGMNCGTNPASVYCIPSGLNTSLSTATKITMEMMFYKGSKDGNAGTNAVFYISGPSSMSSNGTGGTSGYDGNSNYVIGGRVLGTVIYSGNYNSTPNGTYTMTTVIDLTNKAINTKYGSIANLSGSLTDAQISTIRKLKYLRIYSDTTAVIKTINITVE